MKKHLGKITLAVFILILLVISYTWGGNIPQKVSLSDAPSKEAKMQTTEPKTEEKAKETEDTAEENPIETKKEMSLHEEEHTTQQKKSEDSDEDKETSTPQPTETQKAAFSDKEYRCTLSVRCDSVFENISLLDPEKIELIPKDGVILPPTEVTFYEGESVFNLLLREMRKNNIHFEYVNTPLYNSAYIEGINNLYEFDCGELSGWMYKVNGWFPNYGSSRYLLESGDIVEWIYTCNLGRDVGEIYLKQRDS